MNQLKVFFSNRIEHLFLRLKGELFRSPSPFAKRWLIVPNPAIKSWLLLQMAQDPTLQVATGFEVLYLSQALSKLIKLSKKKLDTSSQKEIPSPLELALTIETKIKEKLKINLTSQEQLVWDPLFEYLKCAEADSLSKKGERRLIALSDQLAFLFGKYGNYGKEMIAAWEKGDCTHWQQALWKELFPLDSPWTYPAQQLDLTQCAIPAIPDLSIHVFGMSFLSQRQYVFLEKISETVPVQYFLLSPCRAFWLDIHSDREMRGMQLAWKKQGISESKQVALEDFLRDRNPLLANFGRLGREMAVQIEDSQAQTFQDYELAPGIMDHPHYTDLIDEELTFSPQESPLTLLEAIQADMLVLRNPETQPQLDFSSEDQSIQFHVASSIRREVEIIHDRLMGIIQKHAQDDQPIFPSDIIVMAPDIKQYEPYIKAIFGTTMDYQIMDVQIHAQSSLIQGFLYLLNLSLSRWDSVSILQLLDLSEFQRKQRISPTEAQQIRYWIKEAGVRWGENPEHRNELLKKDHCLQGMVESSQVGTWDHALHRILLGLSMILEHQDSETDLSSLEVLPFAGIEPTQAELLGKLIKLLRSLREDLKPLHDGSMLTLSDWADYLLCLSEAYFAVDSKESESLDNQEMLKTQIEILRKSAAHIPEATFSFASVKHHLEGLLNQENVCYRENHLHAVRFCSMLPMRAVPAKVICLMGMKEGTFPKVDSQNSLNLLQHHQESDFCPSSVDYDRFLFLEILLSARHSVLMSYSDESSGLNQQQLPSLLLSELMGYLDRSYTIEGKAASTALTTKHPFFPFDSRYFTNQTNTPSYSSFYYKAAQAYYQEEKKSPHLFFPEFVSGTFTFHPSQNQHELETIDLKKLADVARNPIKTYFNETLGIYLKNEKNVEVKQDEPFILTALENAMFRKSGLTKPVDHVLALAEKQGFLPLGSFKNIAQNHLTLEIGDMHQNLAKMGVQVDQIFSIEFSSQCQSPQQKEDNNWIVPSILVQHKGKTIQIVGKLSQVTPQGLIVHGKNDPSDIVKAWPHYLMLHCLSGIAIDKKILLTKYPQAREYLIANPQEELEKYVQYYFSCLENLSLLIPEWISELLQGDEESLKNKVQQGLSDSSSFQSLYNDYLLWAVSHVDFSESWQMDIWRDQAEHLYGEMLRKLFPKMGVQANHGDTETQRKNLQKIQNT